MRLLFLPVIALTGIGATEAPPPVSQGLLLPSLEGPFRPCSGGYPVFNPQGCPAKTLMVAPASSPAPSPTPANCRDRIQEVRDASGQPALDKTPATPGDGYLINAVDMRLDGCAVMQMKGNVNDLRPLPAPSGPAGLQPAR